MVFETPAALWLLPAGVVALLLLQLWQARRRELLVGSLFVWRRVAEKERARPRRHLVLDRSFWLQSATLLALALAWAGPVWPGRSAPSRHFVVLVDNGPSSRARQADGKPVWERVRSMTREFLAGLNANDRVILCTSVPVSRHLPSNDGSTPQRTLDDLDAIAPGLTSATPDELWRFAIEEARLRSAGARPIRSLVFSPRPAPRDAADHPLANWVTVPAGGNANNVALTAFGAAAALDGKTGEVLVQVRNFGASKVAGSVSCELNGEPPIQLPAQDVELLPGGVRGVVFTLDSFDRPIRFRWTSKAGPDAMPEDDQVTVMPKRFGAPRVRWYGAAPHLQQLYRLALRAEELGLDDKETVDLEVFVDNLPAELKTNANAVLLLAPPGEYFPFEVLPETLERPVARLGESDPLTRGLTEGTAGLDWPIAKARAVRQVGDLRVLAQDQKGHLLAARFLLKDGRPGYVLAFVPGEGLGWAPERKFDSPGLATVLIRLLREATGAAHPYTIRTAEELERLAGKPLPLEWSPALDERDRTGQGVLDARASEVVLAEASSAPLNVGTLAPAAAPERRPLWSFFVLLAIALVLVEIRAGRTGPVKPQVSVARAT